ncbi:phage tail tape measure protein [Paracoccus seriniphilus]|uniref:Phage tail tape measure protein, lambda family n=1 Tax=Paracoccus seriniphilus TaxID=184748 RepID=A0A239PQ10_9RHOB|nr:phage tail tape measure protein [Paracoccus seriniphilus]WCR14781.1 phage tail tape measure protein [Paracoccus seriniphilus]SNT71807.1 phage tail tape measure protein, lambda family [Paracoccus seriniphilus]
MADKDGFGDRLDGLEEGFSQTGQMTAGFEAELARLRQEMALTSREVGTLSSGIEGGLRRAFDGLVLDGLKFSDVLKDIGQSIADTVYSIATKPVEKALAGSVAQGVAGLMSGIMPFADGGILSQGRVVPFARGGVVSSPTGFPMRGATGLMGEAGPEAIMPLRRGADGRLGVAAEGGGQRAVNVTIHVSTPDVGGFQRSQSQIAAQVSRALARGERNS